MADSKLHFVYKQQLNKWMGISSSRFHLIYKASRDGSSAQAFHQKCDRQAARLVVLAYNPQGYVFGGYTSLSLDNRGSFRNDDEAFIFCLSEAGRDNPQKYPAKAGVGGIYDYNDYGPSFTSSGGYTDLVFFRGTINRQSNNVYTSNSNSQFGQGYNAKGNTAKNLYGAGFQFTDVEVYQIEVMNLLPEDNAWRNTGVKWEAESTEKIKREIEKYSPPAALGLKHVRILLLGQIAAGKSSFFNTVNSAFRGSVTVQAAAGNAPHSLTTKYRMYKIRSTEGWLKLRFCDTMGLEENGGLDVTDIPYLLDGNIPDRFQFNPAIRITPDSVGFCAKPTLQDQIHCAVFVVDPGTVSNMSAETIKKLVAIRSHVNQRGIPFLLVLTKIDLICKFICEKVSNVFLSEAVQQKVNEVSEMFGIPRGLILPIKNYEEETTSDPDVDHLAVTVLRQITRHLDSHFDDLTDELNIDGDDDGAI